MLSNQMIEFNLDCSNKKKYTSTNLPISGGIMETCPPVIVGSFDVTPATLQQSIRHLFIAVRTRYVKLQNL